MAFIQHPPRKAAKAHSSREAELDSVEKWRASTTVFQASDHSHDADWSIVFPGRSKGQTSPTANIDTVTPHLNTSTTNTAPSPFVDHADVEIQLSAVAPPLHDGTGRFGMPSSTLENHENDDSQEEVSPSMPTHLSPPSDSVTLESFSEDEIDINDEISSSFILSDGGSEISKFHRDRLQSTTSSSRWGLGGNASISPSSWAFIRSAKSHSQHRLKPSLDQKREHEVPVVLTSDSESEDGDNGGPLYTESKKYAEEIAFEEALANTHWAHSAGLKARVPKRRHRRIGESEKGSKRSNNSGAITNELLAHRRRGVSARRSTTTTAASVSRNRSRSVATYPTYSSNQPQNVDKRSASEKFVGAVLRKVFGVDDEEVLQSLFKDEGPLMIDEDSRRASRSATAMTRPSLGVRSQDEVWSRTMRQQRMRLLVERRSLQEEEEDVIDDSDDEVEYPTLMKKELTSVHPYELNNAHPITEILSQPSAYPQRARVAGNVAEPSLTEALQATMISGIRLLPGSLSIFLAGSHSVRFMHYLIDRFGPMFTERIRKLVDDGADEATIESVLGTSQAELSPNSSSAADSEFRFKGSAHPVLVTKSPASSATVLEG